MSSKRPLYEKIVDDIKQKILEGIYEPDMKLPTEMELAKAYDVSRITSKRALEELKTLGLIYRIRGSGSFVSASQKNQVEELETGLQKNMVAIIMPLHVTESSFAKSINGAIEVFNNCGYYCVVYSGLKSSEDEKTIIKRLYKEGIKGIIYYPLSDRDNYDLLNTLLLNKYPIVTIDKYFEGMTISNVVVDNYNGAYKVTKHLIDLGHKKIGFVSDMSIQSTTSIRDRYFGYTKALSEMDIELKESFVKTGFADEYHRDYKSKLYKKIISDFKSKGITAIVSVNDLVATYLLRAAIDSGYNVPKELAITGFDDLEMAQHLQVPLTTLRQEFNEIGKEAAKYLIENIEKGTYEYRQIKLPVELVIRKSSSI